VSDTTKGRVLKAIALAIDILAPLIATLTQFPIWINKSSEATVSGVVILLAFFSCIPLLKHIKAFLKSPSIPIIWLVMFVMLTLLNSIIDQMIVVCFIGVISNTIGTIIYKIGEKYSPRKEQ
jgi:hypothetical protein